MGIINTFSAIAEINRLLKDLETQVRITQDQVERKAPVTALENSLNVHKHIHMQLMNAFSNSSGARGSVFTIFGDKMMMDGILTYSKNVAENLQRIIYLRKQN